MMDGRHLLPLKILRMRTGPHRRPGSVFTRFYPRNPNSVCGRELIGSSFAGPRSGRGYLGERIGAWEGQRGLSFLQNMELRAGELLVPRAGLYYIYAQTYFRLSSTGDAEGDANGDAAEEDAAQLVQYIYKKVWFFSA